MKLALVSLLGVFATGASAAINGLCYQGGRQGICIWQSECDSYNGHASIGDCPDDPVGVRCCTGAQCVGLRAASGCRWTHNSCDGGYVSGYCPGGSDFKCYVRGL